MGRNAPVLSVINSVFTTFLSLHTERKFGILLKGKNFRIRVEKMQKTYLPKIKDVELARKFHYLDASELPLGRLATKVAVLLVGKHKKIYTPNIDCGDFVVVSNAEKLVVTGNKELQKEYFHHTGYADGKKIVPFARQKQNDPTKIIEMAVRRMLDANKLRDRRMKRLTVFKGECATKAGQLQK